MADTKITGMTAATALARADLVAVVQDVATTPVNRKATLDVLDPGRVLGGTALATSVVVGAATSGGRNNDVVIGVGAEAPTSYPSDDNVAIGYQANTPYLNGVAIGRGANSGVGNFNVAVGRSATCADNERQTAVGYGASAGGNDATAVGELASADGPATVAVGKSASANAQGTAVGRSASVSTGVTGADDSGTALGRSASCTHHRSIAFTNTSTTATDQVMVGPRDIEITGIVKGIVLVDRTLETRHRVYLDNGTLTIEAA